MSTIREKAERFASTAVFNTADPEEAAMLRAVLATGYERGYAVAAADSAQAFSESLAPAIQQQRAEAWTEGFNTGFYDPLVAGPHDASESQAINPYEEQA